MASSFTPKRKLCLSIGINTYTHEQDLERAVQDAKDVGNSFYSLGFKVTSIYNCKFVDFKKTAEDFVATIHPHDTIAFYYAGHGKELDEVNYLLPTDYNDTQGVGIREVDSIKEHAINVQKILADIHAKQPDVVILILDCCRVKPSSRGGDPPRIATVGNSPQTFVAYSCAPGKIALENVENSHNGFFAKCLVQHLRTPDIDFQLLMNRIAHKVQVETKQKQVPYCTSGLSHELQLTPKPFLEDGFGIPGTYAELPCKGRPCIICNKCRDWYYDDQKYWYQFSHEVTWPWIIDWQNWTDSDIQRFVDKSYNDCSTLIPDFILQTLKIT